MKKTKYLALVLVVAIMMMGAGYAYWSDTLVINNTITTGELNVAMSGESLTDGNDPYTDVEVTLNNNTLTYNVGDLYPGKTINYGVTFTNNGTIPAKFTSISVDYINQAPNDKTLLPENERDHFIVDGTATFIRKGNTPLTIDFPKVTLANINQAVTYINTQLPQNMEPEDVLTLALNLKLDEKLQNNELENQFIGFNMTFNYTQHNAQ